MYNNMENQYYVVHVDYSYRKWHELDYSVELVSDLLTCGLLSCEEKFKFDSICLNDKSCTIHFLCKNTEDFVYQAIHKLIFVVNHWKHTEKLEESDYQNVKKYIISLLESIDFVTKNKIVKSDKSSYQDKLYVFNDLLNILNKKRIELDKNYSSSSS